METYALTFTVQDSSTPTSQTVSKLIELKDQSPEILPWGLVDFGATRLLKRVSFC